MRLHRLEELLKHPVEQVVKTPALLVEMLRLYSEIFLKKKPCSSCDKMHKAYYIRLANEGKDTINNNTIMAEKKTCQLKEGVGAVFHKGQHYVDYVSNKRGNLLTDNIALQLLKKFPGMEKQFAIFPKGYEPQTGTAIVADTKKNLGEATMKAETARKKLKSAVKGLDKMKKEHSDADDAAAGAREKVAATGLSVKVQTDEKDLEAIQEKVDGEEKNLDRANTALDKSKTAVIKAKEALSKASDDKKAELGDKVTDLEGKVTEAEELVEKAEEAVNIASEPLAAAEEKLETSQKLLVEAGKKEKVDELDALAVSLGQDLVKKEEEITELTNDVDEADEDIVKYTNLLAKRD